MTVLVVGEITEGLLACNLLSIVKSVVLAQGYESSLSQSYDQSSPMALDRLHLI